MRFGLENLFCFRKIFRFLLHITRGVTRGDKRHNSPGAESLRGPKSHNNVISTSFNTLYLLPKDLRFEHEGVKLVSCPRRRLTLLRPCTSRLSSQNGEICLQNYPPNQWQTINHKLFKQNAVESKSFDHRK